MARAVGITGRGGPEVLTVVDRAVREPGEGEVRIAVRAAAVNPTDIGLRETGVADTPPPWVPGMDAAGTVEAVGPGVRRLRVGDEVVAVVTPRRPEGGAQVELLVVPEASVVPVPEGASPAEASTLPMNGLTALLGLDLLGLRPGDVLAVTGGAGLLASYVIPLARRAGLVVVADAKPEDERLVREYGADHVVPRGDGFVAAVRERFPDGVDGVYDTALLHERVFGAIRDGGGTVVVRGWRPETTERGITVHRVMVGEALTRTDWLEELRDLASAGVLRLRVAGEYPPEEAAEAHRVMDAGGLRGRVVIRF
jgi:NADPH:quinone reductase-like Zn-dependent oxidoreductase